MSEPSEFNINRSLMSVHLSLYVVLAGIASGTIVSFFRNILPFAALIALLFWLFIMFTYPAALIWARGKGRNQSFARWFVESTGVALLLFVVVFLLRR